MKPVDEKGPVPHSHPAWWRWTKAKDGNLDKEDKSTKATKPKEHMVSIIDLYSFADRLDYVSMLIGTIGAAVNRLIIASLSFEIFMNAASRAKTFSAPVCVQYALDYLWLSILCLVTAWLEVAFWMHTGERQSAKLRAKYLQGVLRQDITFFDTDTNTADIVNSIATDAQAVQDAISEKGNVKVAFAGLVPPAFAEGAADVTGNFLRNMSTFLACHFLAFRYQWRVAIMTLAVLPGMAIAGGLSSYYITRISVKASSAYSEAGSVAHQAISQVRAIYSFVAEKKVVKSYSDALQKPLGLGVKSGMVKGIGKGITFLVLFCSYGLLVWYGGILIRQGIATGGGVLSTIFLVVSGNMKLALAISNLTPFSKAQASAFKILQVIHHEPSINKPDESARTLKIVDGHIELRNVDFFYPSRPDVPIFRNFSLIIPPGQTVAIVGSSGSGKSTVISLIERFYDPGAGEVLLDGLSLKKLDLKWLRRQIGLVNQEPALFGTTIAANIVYGKENATKEEIEEAAKVANAHSFISKLPNGYQTEVGERGVQLSGGQRQRIAIARAVVKCPKILLLDEATSALDAGSEQVVQEALDRVMVGRTTVVVAHRLSTILHANNIAVVAQGRIVESGTHQDLISHAEGAYSALVRLQELPIPSNKANEVKLEISPSNSADDIWAPYQGLPKSTASRHVSARATYQSKNDEILPKTDPLILLKGPMKRLIGMIEGKRIHGVVAVIASMGLGCIGPAYGLFFGYILADYFNPNLEFMKSDLSIFTLLLTGLGIFMFFMHILQSYSLGVVGETLVNRVREKLLAKILSNELGWFDEAENNSSQLTARLASDPLEIKTALADTGSGLVMNFTVLLVVLPLVLFLNWKLALVMIFVAIPLITGANVFEKLSLKGIMKDQAKAYHRATQVAGDAVGNIRTVAAFSAEDKVQALFTNELEGPQMQIFRKGHIAGFFYGLTQFFLYNAQGVSLWYAGKLVESGEATFATVMKIFFMLVISSFISADAFTLAPDIAKGGAAIASLFQIIDRVTKIEPDDLESENAEKIEGDIELRQVTMVYPSRPDVIVLREMNFEVKSGRSLALVGASGSGKSSIIALIERFYDPLSGEVLIDGIDVKKYNLRSLRQHIALVQQEPALFDTTIIENILYGKAGASDAEVFEAAKAANAHNFISSLPEGYQTLVGERGVQLSGGQKQRIAIARAVLKDPTIFLLDEATSALDAESEKVVQEAIDRLMHGRTTVIVAHRLSTIRGADSIAVVENGTILEKGSHNTLLDKGGAYSHLIRLQQHAQKS